MTPLNVPIFAPRRENLKRPQQLVSDSDRTTSTAIGQRAEDAAATYLLANGYQIVARNWKTKACEIDIIATKSHMVHFVEVKYRRTGGQGGGIAAITPQKLRQMKRAATIWLQHNRATDAVLAALEVTGAGYEVTQFLEQV